MKILDYHEFNLPDWLEESVKNYEYYKSTSQWDLFYCELQSDINVAELENLITVEQAWYLREKYLGMKKEDNT